jgi:hypothetical protein
MPGYAGTLGSGLTMAAASLGRRTTAIALGYPALSWDAPVRAGPYRVTVYKPNDRLS